MPIDSLHTHRQAILALATRHGARNVRVFGSVARGETDAGLSPYLQQRILAEAAAL
jgi:predicted nucleotidyltransferase